MSKIELTEEEKIKMNEAIKTMFELQSKVKDVDIRLNGLIAALKQCQIEKLKE